jgi:hypothetical protein
MSNPLDPDESIDDSNQAPLPAIPKRKQRAVGPPTTPKPDRRDSDPEQSNIPVSPMLSNAPHLPQDDPMGLQRRKSGRVRQPPKPRKGDIYEEQNPVKRHRMGAKDWRKLMGDDPLPPDSNQSDDGQLSLENIMAQMAQEGGVSLINFLMQKAVPLHKGNTPTPTSVREWSFCDILKLSKKGQEEWKTACQDELEVLKR